MAFFLCANVAHAEIEVSIKGLKKGQRISVESNLSIIAYSKRKSVSAGQVRLAHRRAEREIKRALEPFGYYAAQVVGSLQQQEKDWKAHYQVTLGVPVRVREASISFDTIDNNDALVAKTIAQFKPSIGGILSHENYETSKRLLQQNLLEQGFLDAELIRHEVAVTRREASAKITLQWRTGPRFRFGPAQFSGAQFDADTLQKYIPWKSGDYFSLQQLALLQTRLAEADYFAAIEIDLDQEAAQDFYVPVQIILIPAPRRIYRGGLALGTDTGVGVRGSVDWRWINQRGHKLKLEADISQRLQFAGVQYRVPKQVNGGGAWNYQISFRDEQTDTFDTKTVNLQASEIRDWHGMQRISSIRAVSGDFTIADETGNSTLLFPELRLKKRVADHPIFPNNGYSVEAMARASSDAILSDTSFAQLRLDAVWLKSLPHNNRVVLRGSLGALWADDFNRLPPELRFFAGGDRSIRGYDYQALGPLNAEGKVIGGKYLALASAEFQHFFNNDWGMAVFVDQGNAFNQDQFQSKTGAGIGLRWKSPVGMLKVDIGAAINDPNSSYRIHLSLGPEL